MFWRYQSNHKPGLGRLDGKIISRDRGPRLDARLLRCIVAGTAVFPLFGAPSATIRVLIVQLDRDKVAAL